LGLRAGVAAPLDMTNFDTDKIILRLHLRTTQRAGPATGRDLT
jgi:3-isopropylmalate dehydratase small subunit